MKLLILALALSGCATGPYNPQAAQYWSDAFAPVKPDYSFMNQRQHTEADCKARQIGNYTHVECD